MEHGATVRCAVLALVPRPSRDRCPPLRRPPRIIDGWGVPLTRYFAANGPIQLCCRF
jgi:hypothetical protein